MASYLLVNGPNLNLLGMRDTATYGTQTLADINERVEARARELGVEVLFFQANGEGAIIDFVQGNAPSAAGIIINPGAYGHYSYAIHDALKDTGLPIAEVHLSNVYARDSWRSELVVAPIARGVISGFGWRGYVVALELLVALEGESG